MCITFVHCVLIYHTQACFHFLSSELWYLLKKCGSTNCKSTKDIQVKRIIIIPRIIFSVVTNNMPWWDRGKEIRKHFVTLFFKMFVKCGWNASIIYYYLICSSRSLLTDDKFLLIYLKLLESFKYQNVRKLPNFLMQKIKSSANLFSRKTCKYNKRYESFKYISQ